MERFMSLSPPFAHFLAFLANYFDISMQVNSGVLSVCTAFLSGEPATRLRSQELQQLIAALLEFMAVCKRAIRVHFRLIGEEDQEFHTQLVNGFQSLTAELSHYIPAILSEL
jgi:hypothetical protein